MIDDEDLFVMCVQTEILSRRIGRPPGEGGGCVLLEEARNLSRSGALLSVRKEGISTAAIQWVAWKIGGSVEPRWYAVFKEALRDRFEVRLNLDSVEYRRFRLHAEEGLEASIEGRGPMLPQAFMGVVAGSEESAILTGEEVEMLRVWVRNVPGGREDTVLVRQLREDE